MAITLSTVLFILLIIAVIETLAGFRPAVVPYRGGAWGVILVVLLVLLIFGGVR